MWYILGVKNYDHKDIEKKWPASAEATDGQARGYDHQQIETKWQKIWSENKLYETKDEINGKEKFYTLVEFPYPSGNLHIGHWYAFAVPDIFARKKRMEGYNVLFPIGFDAFGLPAENAAIKRGLDPKKWTYENISYMEKQLVSMGASFDWSKKVITADPEYYKWTQWLFLQFYKKGLVEKKKANVNWCPKDNTVLANEQVIAGKCERCGTEVIQKDLEQWFFKITDYAERLVKDLDDLNWPEAIKESQRNWIGRSEGAEIEFLINPSPCPLPKGEGVPKFYTTDKNNYSDLIDEADKMRKNPTESENILWQALRRNATGYHFRRQWIIGRFIADFVCLEKKLIVEVDGKIHEHQKEYDEHRTNFLEQNGFKVLRFKNEEIKSDIENVLRKIHEDLETLPFGEGLGGVVRVFTTRADTLYGATYLVLAPEHKEIENLRLQIQNWKEVQEYIDNTKKKTEIERTDVKKEKNGVELKGVKALNPATGEEISIWIADYVLGNYGTGAVMAVPAHDERDFDFAEKYDLPIKEVVVPNIIDKRNPPVEGKEKITRKTVHCIVKNPKTGKYLGLKWREFPWTTFVMGGIEEGESIEEAGRREVRAETGFINLKLVKILQGQVRAEFFAAHKNQNRISFATAVMFELEDESQVEKELEDHEKFDFIWMDESDLNYEKMTHAEMDNWNQKMSQNYTVHTGEGILIDSGEFTRMKSEEARNKIAEKFGRKVTKYKLRDWLLSRQRYWGCPIPVVYDKEGRVHPIPEEHLPWKLPEDGIDFSPKGTSPLATSEELKSRVIKIFGEGWRPEVETMDTFVDSSWYFLRYLDPENKNEAFDKQRIKNWMPVDRYSGGAEHTTMHLLYSRFFYKALFDMGFVPTSEPFKERLNRGLILGPDGQKMSKSKGNVIDPDEWVERVGADTVRIYLAFIGPFNEAGQYPWDLGGIAGIRRFLERVWRISLEVQKGTSIESENKKEEKLSNLETFKLDNLLHKTIKKVTEDIESYKFNTAISSMMILLNQLESEKTQIGKQEFEIFLKLLAPFAPHITEEMWSNLGNIKSIHLEEWPEYDEEKILESEVKIMVQIDGKVRGEFLAKTDINEEEAKEKALKLESIKKWLKNRAINRVIWVPKKLINIVLD